MKFNSDRAFNQLMSQGIVATIRSNTFYERDMVVRITRHGKMVGRGVIIDVVPNTRENREKYLNISGFRSIEEWEKEAKRLHKGKLPDSIIIVGLLGILERT